MIQVQQTGKSDPFEFSVVVRQANGATRHHVTMKKSTYERLGGGAVTPERVIEAAFEFLLERERKETILTHFDVTVISQYFPEFERKLMAGLRR